MKNNILIFILLITFFSCSSNEEQEKNCIKPKVKISKGADPNNSSELALLMRSMLQETASMRLQIEEGNLEFNEDYIAELKKLHSAVPTKDHMKEGGFTGFAKSLITSAESLKASSTDEHKKKYNAMINQCIACHEQVCPGPFVRINKLPLN